MITKDDLAGLGISPGPLFGKIFQAAKVAKTKEEALAIAVAIRDGTFEAKPRQPKLVDHASCLHWFVTKQSEGVLFFPSSEGGVAPSISCLKRMLDQGAITVNGRKPKADDQMELPIWELVFFKGAKGQCTICFDMETAPVGSTWMTPRQELQKGHWVTVGMDWHTKSEIMVDSSQD